MSQNIVLVLALMSLLTVSAKEYYSYVKFDNDGSILTITPWAGKKLLEDMSIAIKYASAKNPRKFVDIELYTRDPHDKEGKHLDFKKKYSVLKGGNQDVDARAVVDAGKSKKKLHCGYEDGIVKCVYADEPTGSFADDWKNDDLMLFPQIKNII